MVAPMETNQIDQETKPYQEEMCEKLIQLSFAKIVNSKSERGGARLHKNLLILHLLQKARWEQRSRLLHASTPMDTTRNVSSESPQQSRDYICTSSMENTTTEEKREETGIEIDETSSQHDDDEEEDVFESKKIDIDEGTFSDRLKTSSGFDGNSTLERPQQATTPRQADDFEFSIEEEKNTIKQNANRSHRRRRSASAKLNRGFSKRNDSSSSSSSSDSDESSSSSEESYSTTSPKQEKDKSRDSNLKRKLDDCDVTCPEKNRNSNLSPHTCDRYSSSHPTKMACLVHGGQNDQNSFQNHQNLSGLISVLQSAALTSSDESIANEQLKDDTKLAFYETDASNDSSLQRSLSCPGLLELTCES